MTLNFQFESLSDFLSMSGHGPFVWACYLVTFLAIGYLILSPILAKRRLVKTLQRQQKIAQPQMSDMPEKPENLEKPVE